MKKIYIMHPLVGDGSPEWGDQRRNVDRYLRICAWATNRGHAVSSWIHHYLLHEAGLTGKGLDGQGCHDFYIPRDLRLIDGCDEVWACGPLAVSAGMRAERDHAKRAGVPVLFGEHKYVDVGNGTVYQEADPANRVWQDPDWYPFGYGPDEMPSPIEPAFRARASEGRPALADDDPPPADLELLASANRMLAGRDLPPRGRGLP